MLGGASQWSSSSSLPQEEQPGRLFIAGISPLVTCDAINLIFGHYGQHFGAVLIDSRHLSVPSQVGNVTFRSVLDAAAAIKELSGTVVHDIPLQVVWADGQLEAIARWQHETQAPQQQQQQQQPLQPVPQPPPIASPVPASSAPQATLLDADLPPVYEVCVRDLHSSIDEIRLARSFAAFPSLSGARIMRDNNSGKARGYGFVTFSSLKDAEGAIAIMNGEVLNGKAIRVSWATKKSDSPKSPSAAKVNPKGNTRSMGLPPTAGAASGFPQSFETIRLSSHLDNTTMYLGELPFSITEDKLTLLVAGFGRVIQIRIQRPSSTPDGVTPKPFAFVKLDSHDGCTKAIQAAGGKIIDGQMIKSGWSKDKDRPVSDDMLPKRRGAGGGSSSAPAAIGPTQRRSPVQPRPYSEPPLSQQPQQKPYQASSPLRYQTPPQQHHRLQQQHQVHTHQQQPRPHSQANAYSDGSMPYSNNAYVTASAVPLPAQQGLSPTVRADATPPHPDMSSAAARMPRDARKQQPQQYAYAPSRRFEEQ